MRLLGLLPDPLPKRRQQNTQPLPPETSPSPTENEATPKNEKGIKLGEHWAIVGATGTGKTYFTMSGLLAHLAYLYPMAKRYILDSTDDPAILRLLPQGVHHVYGNDVPDLLQQEGHTQVWTPRNSKLPGAYAEWFRMLNDAREMQILVVDEIASITGEALEELEALLKQLRKHGGIIIALTQQIAKVTTTLFSQITHYVQFAIGTEVYDVSRARSLLQVPKEEQRNPLYDYGFFYRPVRQRVAMKEYSGLREFFKEVS